MGSQECTDLTPELQELLQFLRENGYGNLRVLEDQTIIGTLDLIYTRSLVIDLDRWGWSHRYCYEDRELAIRACAAFSDPGQPPLPGYVAERHARSL